MSEDRALDEELRRREAIREADYPAISSHAVRLQPKEVSRSLKEYAEWLARVYEMTADECEKAGRLQAERLRSEADAVRAREAQAHHEISKSLVETTESLQRRLGETNDD